MSLLYHRKKTYQRRNFIVCFAFLFLCRTSRIIVVVVVVVVGNTDLLTKNSSGRAVFTTQCNFMSFGVFELLILEDPRGYIADGSCRSATS